MKLEKIKKTYNDYKLELSWGQVEAIAQALAQNHSDPLGDELYAEWQWYMERVPGPGEEEEEIEAQQKAAQGGGEPGAAEGEDLPIPMPPGQEVGTEPGGGGEEVAPPSEEEMGAAGEGGEPEGGELEGGEFEGGELEGGGEGAELGLPEPEPESSPRRETDRRLPEPPRE